jgi:hypothetical protein
MRFTGGKRLGLYYAAALRLALTKQSEFQRSARQRLMYFSKQKGQYPGPFVSNRSFEAAY